MKLYELSGEIADLYRHTRNGVVQVRQMDEEGEVTVRASGTVWIQSGIVLTVSHPFEDRDRIEVIHGSDEPVTAQVRGWDNRFDLAVLEVQGTSVTPWQEWSELEMLNPGELVLTLGYGEIRSGMVCRMEEEATNRWGGVLKPSVEIDGTLSATQAGGPLVNSAGRFAGINSPFPGPGGQTVGYGQLQNLVQDILTRGNPAPGFLGVKTAPERIRPWRLLLVRAAPQETPRVKLQVESRQETVAEKAPRVGRVLPGGDHKARILKCLPVRFHYLRALSIHQHGPGNVMIRDRQEKGPHVPELGGHEIELTEHLRRVPLPVIRGKAVHHEAAVTAGYHKVITPLLQVGNRNASTGIQFQGVQALFQIPEFYGDAIDTESEPSVTAYGDPCNVLHFCPRETVLKEGRKVNILIAVAEHTVLQQIRNDFPTDEVSIRGFYLYVGKRFRSLINVDAAEIHHTRASSNRGKNYVLFLATYLYDRFQLIPARDTLSYQLIATIELAKARQFHQRLHRFGQGVGYIEYWDGQRWRVKAVPYSDPDQKVRVALPDAWPGDRESDDNLEELEIVPEELPGRDVPVALLKAPLQDNGGVHPGKI